MSKKRGKWLGWLLATTLLITRFEALAKMNSQKNLKRSILDIGVCFLCTMFALNFPSDVETLMSYREKCIHHAIAFKRGLSHLPEITSFQDLKWHLFGDPYLPFVSRPRSAEFNYAVQKRLPFMMKSSALSLLLNIHDTNESFSSSSSSSSIVEKEQKVINYLSNLTHILECQIQSDGISFMYFDQNVDGLLPDRPLVSLVGEEAQGDVTGANRGGFGDGGKVKFESVYMSEWLKSISRSSDNTLSQYCVEELQLHEHHDENDDENRQKKSNNNLTNAMVRTTPWIRMHLAEGDISNSFANLWIHGKGAVTQVLVSFFNFHLMFLSHICCSNQ
jgi:hypothetical protein